MVASVPPLVGVKDVVAVVGIELITKIATEPSIIGAVAVALLVFGKLKTQF